MGREMNKTDRDTLESYRAQQNVVCSRALLDALRVNHGKQEPVPEIVPKIEIPLPPIPDKAIAAAVQIAFPPFAGRVDIIKRATISEFPNVKLIDLSAHRRTAAVVKARQIAMYLAKTLTEMSLPEIGRRFGGRDHTTVLHAVRKIDALIPKDLALAAQVERIREVLPESFGD